MSRMLAPFCLLVGLICSSPAYADDPWLTIEPTAEGPGSGKTVLFLSAEEEYRTEESFPMLASILASQGFECTVLFAVNKSDGTIDPDQIDNIPGLEKLAEADLAVMGLRWRHLPDDQMTHIVNYTNSGKPILSIRTNTHPFNYPNGSTSPYAKYDWQNGPTGGGWGREVTGETWVSHYGAHKYEGTRAIAAFGQNKHPLLRGVTDIWGPSDVYGLNLDIDSIEPILMGLVLTGMDPSDPPRPDLEAVPVAWTREYVGESGNTTSLVVTTMGAGQDFENESFRRFVCNAAYYLLDLDVPDRLDVTPPGGYVGRPYGFGGHREGIKPAEALEAVTEYAANPQDEGRFYPPLTAEDLQNWERKKPASFNKANAGTN